MFVFCNFVWLKKVQLVKLPKEWDALCVVEPGIDKSSRIPAGLTLSLLPRANTSLLLLYEKIITCFCCNVLYAFSIGL